MNWLKRAWHCVQAACGYSRTIAVAYSLEILGFLDELKLLDWSSWFGAERAGRIVAAIGIVIFIMRVVTRGPVGRTPE